MLQRIATPVLVADRDPDHHERLVLDRLTQQPRWLLLTYLFLFASPQRSAGRNYESDYRLIKVSTAAQASPLVALRVGHCQVRRARHRRKDLLEPRHCDTRL
jgi:hypothetical protein